VKASCTQKLWEQVETCGIPVSMRVSAVPTTFLPVGTVGTNRIRKILRIELLASYAHEIAHSAAALHYGGLFVPSLSPVVPATFFPVGTLESQYPCGVPICPRCPREKHGEVK
jgi:hypothetical protein